MPVNHTPEFLVLYHSLVERTAVGRNFTEVSMSFNSPLITRGHIYKIVDKCWEPLRNDLREALNLPPIIHVPACPICNQAHTHAHGEVLYDPTTSVVKPLRKSSPPRAPRIAIRKDDMSKAARTLVANLTYAQVKELTQNLLTITNG